MSNHASVDAGAGAEGSDAGGAAGAGACASRYFEDTMVSLGHSLSMGCAVMSVEHNCYQARPAALAMPAAVMSVQTYDCHNQAPPC